MKTLWEVLGAHRWPLLKLEELVVAELAPSKTLVEGRWVQCPPGKFRIDQPTHTQGVGQPHAHVFGRRGDEYGIVNFDGSASHGKNADFKVNMRMPCVLRVSRSKMTI